MAKGEAAEASASGAEAGLASREDKVGTASEDTEGSKGGSGRPNKKACLSTVLMMWAAKIRMQIELDNQVLPLFCHGDAGRD